MNPFFQQTSVYHVEQILGISRHVEINEKFRLNLINFFMSYRRAVEGLRISCRPPSNKFWQMPMFRYVTKPVLALAFFAASCSFAFSQFVSDGEVFDPEAATQGISYSREACSALEKQNTAVWVKADGENYCLRYYAAGLKPDHNPVAVLWLHGDIMGAHESPPNKRLKGLSVDAMIKQERKLSERFGIPSVFLGRPGSYASAGRHYTMRERKIEANIVTAGVDALKEKYGIEKWSLGGHSGGGVLGAVISSAPGAFRDYLATYNSPDTNNPVVLDPIASTKMIPTDPNRRVFILATPATPT
ncbi:hypothetical protein FB593_11830 [Rhizobium sp. SJZ105]|uniref:alpha/beta hydrolase n=1 Tax=Rhizobium sp. SJZ105 TaxID=2572678 RepID=UPI0011A96C02|nr:alpha/beta hydrolase [Rhizobium sp. SJZ105]TWC77168.1 hypothetical protein FB593_11830 [Rhizobium sp. SJZ105]